MELIWFLDCKLSWVSGAEQIFWYLGETMIFFFFPSGLPEKKNHGCLKTSKWEPSLTRFMRSNKKTVSSGPIRLKWLCSPLLLPFDTGVCCAAQKHCGTLHPWHIHAKNRRGETEHSWLCNNETADPQPAGNSCAAEIKPKRTAKDLICMLTTARVLSHVHPQVTLFAL